MVKSAPNCAMLLEDFLSEKEGKGLSKASLKGYRFSIERYIDFLDGKTPTKQTYYSFINSLDCQDTSKVHYAKDVRCFIYWLMANEFLSPYKVSLPRIQEPEPHIVSEDDVKCLLKKRSDTFTEDRMYTVICLILATGLRCRSVVNIKLEDVDFRNRLIKVRATKNKKLLVLPMSEKLYKVLYKYVRRWPITDWLFPTESGKQLTSGGLQTAYDRYSEVRGVPYGIHSLRHYFATEATKNGMSPFMLQRVLGHSDLSVTMRYVNLVNADMSNELNKLGLF